jgi:hypothetical protein
MNKQEALIILNDHDPSYDANSDEFITIWRNYEARSIIYCNTLNEALEEINKLDSKNNTIAIEIRDHFMGSLKDWYCEL